MHITTFILSLFVAKFYTFILSQTHRKIYFLTKMLIRNTGLWISFNVYIIFSLPPPSSSPFNRCSRAKKLQFSVFFFWCDFFSRLLSNFFFISLFCFFSVNVFVSVRLLPTVYTKSARKPKRIFVDFDELYVCDYSKYERVNSKQNK